MMKVWCLSFEITSGPSSSNDKSFNVTCAGYLKYFINRKIELNLGNVKTWLQSFDMVTTMLDATDAIISCLERLSIVTDELGTDYRSDL